MYYINMFVITFAPGPFALTDAAIRFVDRDMFMRFRGGGIGHKPTREATDHFLKDRHPTEEEITSVDEGYPANDDQIGYEDEPNYDSTAASDEELPPAEGEVEAFDSEGGEICEDEDEQ